ncbi:conserved hypothetical protein [Mycoplasmopsis pulmonis]|uniref:L-threonylcarbamoyladenylate synthase n=1 Tax=Mycoplasmopsis pulmonis (strain UAB CTIP) TaxID=272635 RepID=Q98PV6_MYCPU|nr:L-threonylcarbamoyladenylate synthase [Mycoplasmopsis pulmonis]MDZ7293586.1 L-threonylcarbamoyladenylate synthase [Mycoplasmopsis pulmonis]CAC13786.1 conserved hypothetical protein [Mycoplasmopsis pulmonis]VEU68374.1 translation factor, SUA5 domain [Mycoplasmopsis pulmonis]
MKINDDDLLVFTTDTLIGLGGKVSDVILEKIYEIKKRPIDKKMIILVGSLAQAQSFSQWNLKANKQAQKYWPGATTLIVNDQGFRMPKNKALCKFLIEQGPLYTTSANLSGFENIKTLDEAKKIFPQIKHFIDFGKGSGIPSQIIDIDKNIKIR